MNRSTTNNRMQIFYQTGAGPFYGGANIDSITSVDWICYALTWSLSGDACQAWISGAASGAEVNSVVQFKDDLGATVVNIGAASTTPTNVWSGSIGPVALWNKALSADQIANLSKV